MILGSLSPRRLDYKWLVYGTIAIGTFVSVVDQTAVNLALPRIADHFDATIPAVQWVALAYILTTGSLLLPMGGLSDMIGRKRVYVVGFVVFCLGAILTGSSTALVGLILFKVFQGVGAAMVQSNAMAIVASTFPGSERGKVIGLFMTVVGIGAIAGPVLGGAVVGLLGWRFVFFLGVPFGIASIVAAIVVLEGERPASAGGVRFDWPGAALSASALVVFLLAMTNAHRIGWGSPPLIAAFVVAAALLVAFVLWERRSPEPMLALELFKRRLFTFGTTAGFLSFLPGTSVFFLMPFYLQMVLGYTPGQTGLIIAPTALCFAAIGPIAGRLSDRFGSRPFTLLGLTLTGMSLFVLSRLTETASLWIVVGALLMQGVGMGAFFSPNASSVLSVVERSRYGIATAYLNMVRNIASVIGVGLATTIVTAVMASSGFEPSLDAISSVGGEGVSAAFTKGLRTAYLIMLVFVAIALVLSFLKGEARAEEAVPSEADRRLPSKV